MKVRITKTKKFYPKAPTSFEIGESVEGELDSWTELTTGNMLVLKNAKYSNAPSITIKETIICKTIKRIIDYNYFEGSFSEFKIEKL